MNRGELDELKAALSLIYWRDNYLNNIESVGFYRTPEYIEYYEYKAHDLTLREIGALTEEETEIICRECSITKAPSSLKADICINQTNVSLKSNRSALPALINHTHREGMKKVCDRINISIAPLDDAILDYWNRRESGNITEDVKMSTPNNPFEPIKEYLITLLAYFLFTGTARADSLVQAEEVISFTDPVDYDTWTSYTKAAAARQYIDRVTISLRSKAMPSTYNHNAVSDRDKIIATWTRFSSGAYRGSFHVRG